MTYARYTCWHQLFVYSCNSCLLSTYMMLFSYPSVICLSCYFSYLISAVYLVIILCILFICTGTSPFHTLTGSLSDDPGFVRPDIGRFVAIIQLFVWSYALRGDRVSLLDYRYSCSFINVISWFYLYRIQLPFSFLYSSIIVVLDIYVIL